MNFCRFLTSFGHSKQNVVVQTCLQKLVVTDKAVSWVSTATNLLDLNSKLLSIKNVTLTDECKLQLSRLKWRRFFKHRLKPGSYCTWFSNNHVLLSWRMPYRTLTDVIQTEVVWTSAMACLLCLMVSAFVSKSNTLQDITAETCHTLYLT